MSDRSLPRYASRKIKESGRQYFVSPLGDKLPSVTTILNATKPAEDWERLMNWKREVGEAQAAQITQTASRRGTGTHRHIQHYLEGKAIDCPDSIRPYWESIEPVLASIEEVRLTEGTVFHHPLQYAGIVDCVASYDGIPCICEWKTADKPKRSLERLYDYPLQVAAYWGAVNELYADQGVDIRHALLVVALPEQPAEMFWFEPNDLAEYWNQWEARVRRYWRRFGQFPR